MLLSAVTKIYGAGEIAVRALRSIDFRVDRGDYVAIMGSSGSGKSTLMNIIGCLDVPTEGHYLLEQLDVAQLDDHELAFIRSRRIGLVFQSYNLIPRTSVLRNVELPLVYQRIKADERRDRATRACELVGLHNRTHHIPSELSGGQQQRAAIARALAMQPKVMLFDEATSSLDPELRREVLLVMRELAVEGMTMLVVTHEMGFARHVGTRVAFMDRGEIVEEAPAATFFDAPRTDRAKKFLQQLETE